MKFRRDKKSGLHLPKKYLRNEEGFIIIPPGGGVSRSWSTWDEITGTPWDSEVNIMIPSGGAGANETSQGIVSGADLDFTQFGNIAAATGSGTAADPYKRPLDGVDDELRNTQNWADTILGNSNNTWSIFMSLSNVTQSANDRFVTMIDSGAFQARIIIDTNGAKLRLSVWDDGGAAEQANSVDDFDWASSNRTILGVWADGTNPVRMGWITNYSSLPTEWADFNPNKRIQSASYTGTFSGKAFSGATGFFSDGAGADELACTLYWIVAGQYSFIS